jgi:hypothetical protein
LRVDNLRLAKRWLPFPETHVTGVPVKEGDPYGPVVRVRSAIAEVDGFHRNGWTIWIGTGGRVQPEYSFATLQTELLDRGQWPTRQALMTGIFSYIEWLLQPEETALGSGATEPGGV